MLVLTRKTQERIHIGDNITLTILKLKGNTVRIGIEAPRDVRVLRGELPTFDGTVEIELSDSSTTKDSPAARGTEQSEVEATVSELEWEVLKKIASRRKPCLAVRRCSVNQSAAASHVSNMRAAASTISAGAISR